jgi:hypothetical protein
MSQQLEPLKQNDEVFIKSLEVVGKVIQVCPDGDDEPFYRVEITRYFRRADLELIDREAEQKKRKQEVQEKLARMEAARIKTETIIAAGGVVDWATAQEYMLAADDLWQAFGHKSIFQSTENK